MGPQAAVSRAPVTPLDDSLQWHHDDPRPLITLLRHTCSGVAGLAGATTTPDHSQKIKGFT